MIEQGVIFHSNNKQLIGIEHLPKSTPQRVNKKGVIIVVGGPQTRVGSHRLFVYLARALAKQGITVFRFDYSGAGDSEGELSTFTEIQHDIDAAICSFKLRHNQLTEIALWGLCDAASAILLYLNDFPAPKEISQLILVNPWVRQTDTEAKTYLRSYYTKRFFSKAFWQKLLSGKIEAKLALSDIQTFHQQSQANNELNTDDNFVKQMLEGLRKFPRDVDIILSGNDLTADEFRLLIKNDKQWHGAIAGLTLRHKIINHANHTFSRPDTQKTLINFVCQVLEK